MSLPKVVNVYIWNGIIDKVVVPNGVKVIILEYDENMDPAEYADKMTIDGQVYRVQEYGELAEKKARLEYLRQEIEAERISYGEIVELQSLVEYIDEDDVLLLQWAGVEEKGGE